ncbi:uncharacterized protein J3D65DRAFT_601064 [Phyllosticta citribraziliensis]|uniref:Uncharacterized protein n=1 Tax=Phyllosticta citribraziliensis TaxID=989973 RepID=A0ABR1M0I2_9PEZI
MGSRSLNEYMFSTGPMCLNPHDQQQVTREMSPRAVAAMRTKLTAEIATLRVQSARETQRRDWNDIAPIDKPSTRTLFVRLSQLAVLDARYPLLSPSSAASSNNGGADGSNDDSECLVAPERCDWSYIGAGLNPNFAYEGPWGPKKTVDAPSSVVDLERPVSPKTVVGFPQRARVRASTATSAQRRSTGTGRYYAGTSPVVPRPRVPGPSAAISAFYPALPSSSRPGPTRRVQRPRRNSVWVAQERTDCGVM